MRVASATRPASSGTFRSARMKTRLPLTSSDSSARIAGRPRSEALADEQGNVAHAVREAPLVVVPRENLDEGAVDHVGQLRVERGRHGGAVEVARDERLVYVREHALERAVRR